MIETTTRRWSSVVTVISVLIVVESVTFLLAALLHTGIQFPLGISQPRIIPATIVEGLCGLFLAVSAYAVFARKTWAWRVAIAAHAFAVVGVLLGIFVTIRNPGSDEANALHLQRLCYCFNWPAIDPHIRQFPKDEACASPIYLYCNSLAARCQAASLMHSLRQNPTC